MNKLSIMFYTLDLIVQRIDQRDIVYKKKETELTPAIFMTFLKVLHLESSEDDLSHALYSNCKTASFPYEHMHKVDKPRAGKWQRGGSGS